MGSKNKNYQFKLKFGTQTNWNMQTSIVVFTFFCFRSEIPFLGKFDQESQNCQFKMKFGTYNHFHNILRLFDVLPTFISREVKRCAIIYHKHGIFELPDELLNDLRLRILGN